jgi:histidine triad (HIT) family protein
MTDCLFCKIVEGEIPSLKIAESTNLLAFLDINPSSDGHTLIVPKKHSTNLLDLPEYSGNELLEFSQRVGNAVIAATGAEGFNFVLNNGPAAGQVVFHTHFHIIPRRPGDGIVRYEHKGDSSKEHLEQVRQGIIEKLS